VSVLLAIGKLSESAPVAAGFLRDAVAFSSVGLLAMWLVFARKTPVMMSLVGVVAVLGVAILWNIWPAATRETTGDLLAIYAVATLIGLCSARLFGLRIGRASAIEPSGIRIRYSLRSLFLLTTIAALAARPLFAWHAELVAAETVPTGVALLALATPAAIATLLIAWAVLSPRPSGARTATMLLAAALSGGAAAALCGREADGWEIGLWLGLQAAFVAAPLAVVRACGYRFGRRATDFLFSEKGANDERANRIRATSNRVAVPGVVGVDAG
jgi:hypothetical protein